MTENIASNVFMGDRGPFYAEHMLRLADRYEPQESPLF
jgi:hypothetical protein